VNHLLDMPLHSMSQIIEKSWGYEKIIHNSRYCMKLLVYTKPIASSLHFHIEKHECFFIASGLFKIETDGGPPMTYEPGDHVEIPAGMKHRVRCVEPGCIVEASTYDDPQDCIRLEPSES
jgi:quercetin dioxygenase-like cupin family protein